MSDAPHVPLAEPQRLNAGVLSVGAASFFSDSGHEIATSILPSFLTSVLHAGAGALGLIEGIADMLQGVLSMVGGPLANDPSRRGRMGSSGYLGTALATGAIGLAGTVWQVGALRALAWMSRGFRSPARDSMLASMAQEGGYGRAYGVERAGDNLGAVVGPLLAAGLVTWVGIRHAIYFSAIPGVLAAIAIAVAARYALRFGGAARRRARFELAGLRRAGLMRPLVPVACFEVANVATTLLILRATQLLHAGGRSLTAAAALAILIYAGHNVVAALVALLGGRWVDRAGPRVVFGAGAAAYVLAYAAFGLAGHGVLLLVAAFALAGTGIGLAETAESALVAQLLPDALRGSGFGLLGGIQSFGGFASSAIVGLLYAALSPAVGFLYAAAWMVVAVTMTLLLHMPVPTAPA